MAERPRSSRFATTLMATSAGASALLAAALLWTYRLSGSELALAQMADSAADVATSIALLWAMRVSAKPPDENHPFGHQNAQPVAALVVAVLVGVLSAEVIESATRALLFGHSLRLGWGLLIVLGAKTALKGVLTVLTAATARTEPAVHAFRVDARNDVLLGLTSLAGFFGAKYGAGPEIDAWLALPVGVWIGLSGVMLGWQSIQLLLGQAPSSERQETLRRLAADVPGVIEVRALKARHHGNTIQVWLEIRVDRSLTVGRAHDIGEAVEARLLDEPDVSGAMVHVDG